MKNVDILKVTKKLFKMTISCRVDTNRHFMNDFGNELATNQRFHIFSKIFQFSNIA